jgi:DNA repair exonuclease SbcCD ATPase subunit
VEVLVEMSEGYSKIKSITLENFMGYEKGTVVFDDSGILNFKGYNGAGKSAFLTGLAVTLMNLYPNKQVNYIRHGEKYFRVIVAFDDGVTIVRDKYSTGQSLYEMYRNDKLIFTTKAGDKLTKVNDVPESIKNYLGLVSTDIGFLNYQVRRDPLWLIDTKGSENYASLHEILKSEEISRANALINSDRNTLNDSIVRVEAERNSLKNELDSVLGVGEELLARLYERETFVQGLLARGRDIEKLGAVIDGVCSEKVLPEIGEVELGRLEVLGRVAEGYRKVESSRVFSVEVGKVDTKRYEELDRIELSMVGVKNCLEGSGGYFGAEIGTIGGCDSEEDLIKIARIAQEYQKAYKELQGIRSEEHDLETEKNALVEEAESDGMKFAVCDNCGTLLMI